MQKERIIFLINKGTSLQQIPSISNQYGYYLVYLIASSLSRVKQVHAEGKNYIPNQQRDQPTADSFN
jgi:hypothetical protein